MRLVLVFLLMISSMMVGSLIAKDQIARNCDRYGEFTLQGYSYSCEPEIK